MRDRGAIMYCHDAKRDANDFDRLVEELNSIKKDKQVIQDMELSDEAKQKCFEDLDKQLADVKERMHNAIDEMQKADKEKCQVYKNCSSFRLEVREMSKNNYEKYAEVKQQELLQNIIRFTTDMLFIQKKQEKIRTPITVLLL